jgi:ADP-ribosylglycohydrolase
MISNQEHNNKPAEHTNASLFSTPQNSLAYNPIVTRDKITGMLLGTAIGDALGLPYETHSADEIRQNFSDNPHFRSLDSNPYLNAQDDNLQPGCWSDDTQLTLAVMEGISRSGEFSLAEQMTTHIEALQTTTRGWGNSTREAIERLAEGVSPAESAAKGDPTRGVGNGVCIQIAPVAAHLARHSLQLTDYVAAIMEFTQMTHHTAEAVTAAFAHVAASHYCFNNTAETFSREAFMKAVVGGAELGSSLSTQKNETPLTLERLLLLQSNITMEPDQIIAEFDGGECPVFQSLPFSYAFFLRDPHSIQSMYDAINGGGDTDSNGSMVGGLLGALHGSEIFPGEYINGLEQLTHILETEQRFAASLGL